MKELADAIINHRPTISCVNSVLMGEHECKEVALSIPSVVGPSRVQQRIRERWASEEYRAFLIQLKASKDIFQGIRTEKGKKN